MRSAISGDSAALPLTRSDRGARRTPRISAARVTGRCSSCRISSRMNSLGWQGLMPTLVIGSLISGSPQVQIGHGFAFDPSDPPVAGHRDAPRSRPVTGKLVDAPAGRSKLGVGRSDQPAAANAARSMPGSRRRFRRAKPKSPRSIGRDCWKPDPNSSLGKVTNYSTVSLAVPPGAAAPTDVRDPRRAQSAA